MQDNESIAGEVVPSRERAESPDQVIAQAGNGLNPAPLAKTPFELIAQAAQGPGDLAEKTKLIESLMTLQERHERNEAEKAYHKAVAKFKATPIHIGKDKANTQYGSMYTSLSELVNTVNAALSPCGLSAHWTVDQTTGISVTCILAHNLGHSESVTISGPPDKSGSKNELQMIKSTITYLKGATYEAITGVASSDGTGVNQSDDGDGFELETIDISQSREIHRLLEVTKSDPAAFMKAMRCEGMDVGILPADKYDNAIKKLKEKEAKQA